MNIAILGAGVAGLSAARELKAEGATVTIFDKSRGVGGRMSTRYAGDWEFDHGAQFFTIQDAEFKSEIDRAIAAGVVAPWPARAMYLKAGALSVDTGRARFVAIPRMNSLPKYWAQGLDIQLGRRVRRVVNGQSWTLEFEDGSAQAGFDAVISTLPPAQAQRVLPENFQKMPAVVAAEMHVCFCLMIGLSVPVDVGWDTLRVKDSPIDWIAMNNVKPGRNANLGAIVVHSAPEWSDHHAEADRDWVQQVMIDAASTVIGQALDPAPHITLHRWLYASSKASPDVNCLSDEALMAAGDWCLGGRVQGAWLSGRAAAQDLLKA